MEFKQKDDIVIIDEKKNKIFEKDVDSTYPCDGVNDSKLECSKRWLETFSDCV